MTKTGSTSKRLFTKDGGKPLRRAVLGSTPKRLYTKDGGVLLIGILSDRFLINSPSHFRSTSTPCQHKKFFRAQNCYGFGFYTKDGGKPLQRAFFRQVSEQFSSHFSSTERALSTDNFRNYGSHTHAAGSTSFYGENLL